ncbi:MAG TPA: peptidylprolyl isomerase [Candidatus Acidoferrum sp.]|nr:peptidylprolyl isomerase [Candidatus Acidoferrum sp.]
MKRAMMTCGMVLAAMLPAHAQVAASHSSVAAAAHTTPSLQVSGKPVARVNGAVLTDRDLLREMYLIFPYARQHNGTFPKEMEAGIRNGALQMIVFEELVYQEALRRKMSVAPLKLQGAETDFKKQFATPEEYQAYLNAEFSGSPQVLREKIRRSLLIDALLDVEVAAKAKVTLPEARAFYEKNPAPFQYPESFAFQTISVLPPEKATPKQLQEGRKRAEDALRQAKMTKTYEEFGLLAEKLSDDDYRVMMGDHKFVDRAKLAPNVVQAMLAMQPGQVSEIIQIEQAYTIVRLNKHVLAGKMSFADIKDKLKKELEAKKTNELRAVLDKKLRSSAKVEVL